MTGSVEEFDWLDDLTAAVEERDARTEERRKLREDIARLNDMDTVEELSALLDRVASAMAGTNVGIESYRRKGDDAGLARAEYALEMFNRAKHRIEGRRRLLVRLQAERVRAIVKQKQKETRRARQLAQEKEHAAERLRREEHQLQCLLAAAKVEEEKTRRHLANRDREHRIKAEVLKLIRDRGLVDAGVLRSLFREAEEAVERDGTADVIPEASP